MSEWISVEDRLPEANDTLRVAGHIGESKIFVSQAMYQEGDGWVSVHAAYEYQNVESYGFEDSGLKVTHWQPLPEPPK